MENAKNVIYATLDWETVQQDSMYERFHDLFSLHMDARTKDPLDPDAPQAEMKEA